MLGGPPGGTEQVERPSRRAGRGRKALQVGWEGSGGEGSGWVGKPSRRAGKCMEALSGVYGGHLEGPRVVGRPSRRAGSGRESLPEGLDGL